MSTLLTALQPALFERKYFLQKFVRVFEIFDRGNLLDICHAKVPLKSTKFQKKNMVFYSTFREIIRHLIKCPKNRPSAYACTLSVNEYKDILRVYCTSQYTVCTISCSAHRLYAVGVRVYYFRLVTPCVQRRDF